jgi:HK97 family phage major capsid protein
MPQIIGRPDIADALIPDQVITEVIQELPKASAVLARARRIALSKKKAKQPVLASLPSAYWVNGDTGLKRTTKADWKDTSITAEELAAIVPIPDALIDDADIPLWDAIKPLLIEAIGLKVDQAALFGVDAPDSWPDGVVPAAIAAGNVIALGTGQDIGVDVAALGEKIAKQGYGVNGFASRPGLQWKLVGLRSATGQPIYTSNLNGNTPTGLYGFPLNEVDNGAWVEAMAEILAADWNKFVVGVRQDITFSLFSEGVISDEDGKVLYNLMQQDMKALRVVSRVGFQVARPLTRLGGPDAYPAGVILPAATAGDILDNVPDDTWTVARLTAFAEAEEIDIFGLTRKADILAAILAALAN